mmetsp:Transcript_133444/g.302712  ORF Transcript_133444/g.302712 Transcript_133444/m.302712 type:complete len:495 (+) Transcript_133444:126-1610(+)
MVGCFVLVAVAAADRFLNNGKEVPGMSQGNYFEEKLKYNPVKSNPYVAVTPLHLGDLEPVAPLDRIDKTALGTWTDFVPLDPAGGVSRPVKKRLAPDYIPKIQHANPFPDPNQPGVELDPPQAHNVPLADKLRPAEWSPLPSYNDPKSNYPPQAPKDRVDDPHFAAPADQLDGAFAKYFDQLNEREKEGKVAQKLDDACIVADTNKDSAISKAEYETIAHKMQKSTADEDLIWARIKSSAGTDTATCRQWKLLAQSGYDVPTKLSGYYLSVKNGVNVGYWGTEYQCALGSAAQGVALKLQNCEGGNKCTTGLNGIRFLCGQVPGAKTGEAGVAQDATAPKDNVVAAGKTMESSSGPDGDWTDMVKCKDGGYIFGLRMRVMQYQQGVENLGVTNMMVSCRSPDGRSTRQVWFADEALKDILAHDVHTQGEELDVVAAAVADHGGWSSPTSCPPKQYVCSLKTRVQEPINEEDIEEPMGVTTAMFRCCSFPAGIPN